MYSEQQPVDTNQVTGSITAIDSSSLVEHGTSPTAVILSVTILIATLIRSMTGLLKVLLKQSKLPQ